MWEVSELFAGPPRRFSDLGEPPGKSEPPEKRSRNDDKISDALSGKGQDAKLRGERTVFRNKLVKFARYLGDLVTTPKITVTEESLPAIQDEFACSREEAIRMSIARSIATEFKRVNKKATKETVDKITEMAKNELGLLTPDEIPLTTLKSFAQWLGKRYDIPKDLQGEIDTTEMRDKFKSLVKKQSPEVSGSLLQKAYFYFTVLQDARKTIALFPKTEPFWRWYFGVRAKIFSSDAPTDVKKKIAAQFHKTLDEKLMLRGTSVIFFPRDTSQMSVAEYAAWMAQVYKSKAKRGHSGPPPATVLAWTDAQQYEDWKVQNPGTAFKGISYTALKRFYGRAEKEAVDLDAANKALVFYAFTKDLAFSKRIQEADKRFPLFSRLWIARASRTAEDTDPSSSSSSSSDDDDDDVYQQVGDGVEDVEEYEKDAEEDKEAANRSTVVTTRRIQRTTEIREMTQWDYFRFLIQTQLEVASDNALIAWLREISIILSPQGEESAAADAICFDLSAADMQKARMMVISLNVDLAQAVASFGGLTGEILQAYLRPPPPPEEDEEEEEEPDIRFLLFAIGPEAEAAKQELVNHVEQSITLTTEEIAAHYRLLYNRGKEVLDLLTNVNTSLEDFFEWVKEVDNGYAESPKAFSPADVDALLRKTEEKTRTESTSVFDAKWNAVEEVAMRRVRKGKEADVLVSDVSEVPPKLDLLRDLYDRLTREPYGMLSDDRYLRDYHFPLLRNAQKAMLFFAAKKPDYSVAEVFKMFGAAKGPRLRGLGLVARLDEDAIAEDVVLSGEEDFGSKESSAEEIVKRGTKTRSGKKKRAPKADDDDDDDDAFINAVAEFKNVPFAKVTEQMITAYRKYLKRDADEESGDVEDATKSSSDSEKLQAEDEFSSSEEEEEEDGGDATSFDSEDDDETNTVLNLETNLEEVYSSSDSDDDDDDDEALEELNTFVGNLFTAKKNAKNAFRLLTRNAASVAKRRGISLSAAEIRGLIVRRIRAAVVEGGEEEEEEDETVDREFLGLVDQMVGVYVDGKFTKLFNSVKQKAGELNLMADDDSLIKEYVVEAISEYFGDLNEEEEEAEQDVILSEGSDDEGGDNVSFQELERINKPAYDAVIAGIDDLILLHPLPDDKDIDEHIDALVWTVLYYYGTDLDDVVGDLMARKEKLPATFDKSTWVKISESGVDRLLTESDFNQIRELVASRLGDDREPEDAQGDAEIAAALILARGDLEEAFALLNIQ